MDDYTKRVLLFGVLITVVGIIISFTYSKLDKPEDKEFYEYLLPMMISLFITGSVSYWLNDKYFKL
jgi:hypothetical protein